jgi:cell division protein FtsB
VTELEQSLQRENAYLKQRNAQLQSDVTDLEAQLERLNRTLERNMARRAEGQPNPLSGGQ